MPTGQVDSPPATTVQNYRFADDPLRGNAEAIAQFRRLIMPLYVCYVFLSLVVVTVICVAIASPRLLLLQFLRPATSDTLLVVQMSEAFVLVIAFASGLLVTPKIIHFLGGFVFRRIAVAAVRFEALAYGVDPRPVARRLFKIGVLLGTLGVVPGTNFLHHFKGDRLVKRGFISIASQQIMYADVTRIVRWGPPSAPQGDDKVPMGYVWTLSNGETVDICRPSGDTPQRLYDDAMSKISIKTGVTITNVATRP